MQVYSDPPSLFLYFYLPFFKDMGFFSSFPPFVMEVLRVLNVAPSHLLYNNWCFIRAFEMVCEGIEIYHIVGIFFSFCAIRPLNSG